MTLAGVAYREIKATADYELTADAFKMILAASEVGEVLNRIARGGGSDATFVTDTMKVATKLVAAAEGLLGRTAHDNRVMVTVVALDMAMRHIGLPISEKGGFLDEVATDIRRHSH